MSTVIKDLAADKFYVPIIYKHSPLVHSLINEVHWHLKAAVHSGVETVWRYVLKTGCIIFERDLVKKIKICSDCSRLNPGVPGEHLTSQLSWLAAYLSNVSALST